MFVEEKAPGEAPVEGGPKDWRDLARQAADRIRHGGHCKQSFSRKDLHTGVRAYCILGSVCAHNYHVAQTLDSVIMDEMANHCILNVQYYAERMGHPAQRNIVSWNDDPRTTAEDVINLLEGAASYEF